MDSTTAPQSADVLVEKKDGLAVTHESFSKLMFHLYQRQRPKIKLKRVDRENYGSFSTVVRCSSALILLREEVTGLAEALPDMRYVSHFILQDDSNGLKANVEYSLL